MQQNLEPEKMSRRDFLKLAAAVGGSTAFLPLKQLLHLLAKKNPESTLITPSWDTGWWYGKPDTFRDIHDLDYTPLLEQDVPQVITTPTPISTPYPRLTFEQYLDMTNIQRQKVYAKAQEYSANPTAKQEALKLLPWGFQQSAMTIYTEYRSNSNLNGESTIGQGSGGLVDFRNLNGDYSLATVISAGHVVEGTITRPGTTEIYTLRGMNIVPPINTVQPSDLATRFPTMPILELPGKDIAVIPFLVKNGSNFPFIPLGLNNVGLDSLPYLTEALYTYPSPFGVGIPQIVTYEKVTNGFLDVRTDDTVALGASGALVGNRDSKALGVITDVPKSRTALLAPLTNADRYTIERHLVGIQTGLNRGY